MKLKWDYKTLSLLIGISYIVIGGLVLLYKKFFLPLSNQGSLALGLLLVIYGLYRAYRALKYMKNNEE